MQDNFNYVKEITHLSGIKNENRINDEKLRFCLYIYAVLHAYLPSYRCNHYPCQNDLALQYFLAVSERLFTENILSHL